MATLNVQDYGASGDGSGDDSGEIEDAIYDASAGDTVYIPEGHYRVMSGGGASIGVNTSIADDVTVEGDGEGTFIEMGDVSGGNMWVLGVDGTGGTINGFTVRNLRISGNRAANSEDHGDGWVAGIHHYPNGGTGHDILYEDVMVHDCAGAGINMGTSNNPDNGIGFVEVNRCTILDNERHGLSIYGPGEHQNVIRNTLVEGSGSNGRGPGNGVNINGDALIENCFIANNIDGRNKVSNGGVEVEIRNTQFVGDGFYDTVDATTAPYDFHCVMDEVAFSDADDRLYLRGMDGYWDFGRIKLENFNQGGFDAAIEVQGGPNSDTPDVDIGELYICDSANDGIYWAGGGGGEANISEYYYSNLGGSLATGNTGYVNIGQSAEQGCPSFDVPTREEVGAWSGGQETFNPDNVYVSDCYPEQEEVEPGGEATLVAGVQNDNPADASVTVEWEVDGKTATDTIVVPGEGVETATGTVVMDSAEGEYEILIELFVEEA